MNNQTFMGSLEAESVFEDVCNSMKHPPQACKNYVENWYMNRSQKPEKISATFFLELSLAVTAILILIAFLVIYISQYKVLSLQEGPYQRVNLRRTIVSRLDGHSIYSIL